MLSLFWFVPLLLPQEINETLLEQAFFSAAASEVLPWLMSGLYILTVLLLEPLYVATGFMLYLNRRTILEAWDVELSFRRMHKRLTGNVPALLLAGLIFGNSLPEYVQAQNPPPAIQTTESAKLREESKALIKEVLAAPEFETYIEVQQLKHIGEEDEDNLGFDGFNFGLGTFLARLVEVMLWCLLGMGVILLYVHREKWLRIFKPKQPAPSAVAVECLFGLDIRPESLPDDVAKTARKLWHTGCKREAMSLLYRGTLAALVHQQGITFSSSHTENNCLHILQPLISQGQFRHFQALTHAWQETAYAHRPPKEVEMLDLCNSWGEYYEISAEPTTDP